MKTSILLALLFLRVCAFAQKNPDTLKPRMFIIGKDTTLCFNSEQAKEIAKLIVTGESDREKVSNLTKQNALLVTDLANQRSIVQLREKEIALHQENIIARDSVINKLDGYIAVQKMAISARDKQLKRQRRLTRLTGVLGLLGIGLALFL